MEGLWDTQVRNCQGWELDICSPSTNPAVWTQSGEDKQYCPGTKNSSKQAHLGYQENTHSAAVNSKLREVAFQVEIKAKDPQAVHAKS